MADCVRCQPSHHCQLRTGPRFAAITHAVYTGARILLLFGGMMVPKHCYAAVIAASLILISAFPAHAQDAHGSIAVGHTADGESVAYGFAWNHVTKEEAREAALNACRAGGGADCVERAWFQNGCGALAIDQYGNGGAKGAMTQDQAEARALQTCEARGGSGCAVVGSQCASPGREAGTWSGREHVLAAPATDADEQRAEEGTKAAEAQAESLTREQRIHAQRGLAALGFDAGPADGIFGPRTKSAIWEWQRAKGLEASGNLTSEQAEALGAVGKETNARIDQPDFESEPAGEKTREEGVPEASDTHNVVLHFPRCNELDILDASDPGCWMEIVNSQDCDIFVSRLFLYDDNAYTHHKSQFSWSGHCQHNAAHGQGTLEHNDQYGATTRWSGEFVEGKMQDQWVRVWRSSDLHEVTDEGLFVNGLKHGRWVETYRWPEGDENTQEGLYVEGLRHGRWIETYRWPSGGEETKEGLYKYGEKHGRWVRHKRPGSLPKVSEETTEGSYINGRLDGLWVEHFYRFDGGGRIQRYECHDAGYLGDCKSLGSQRYK